jgi:hypothetical protein
MDSIVPAESDGKVAPTDAERLIAESVVANIHPYTLAPRIPDTLIAAGERAAELVAQALADQRVKYEALADKLDREVFERRRVAGATPCCDAAKRIRQVAC